MRVISALFWGGHVRVRSRLVHAAAMSSLVCAVLFVPTAARAATCSSNTGPHTGTIDTSTGWAVEGVKAVMTTPGGYVLCSGNTNGSVNFSTAWVMVVGNANNFHDSGYIQAGTMYRYGYGSCVMWWAEEASSPKSWIDYYLPGCAPQDGSTHYIQVYYNNGGGGYHFIEQAGTGSVIHSSTLNLSIMVGTVVAQYYGEVRYPESHVPGSPSQPVNFTSKQIQDLQNDQFYDNCGRTTTSAQSATNMPSTVVSCDASRFYDTRN